jgi:transcriptional regulator GlxA family with amidase domain
VTETPAIRTAGILAFDRMEVLDYAGPYEVFNVAAESAAGRLRVQSIGVGDGPVSGRGGFTVIPHVSLASSTPPDILVIPGGAGSRALLHDQHVIEWVRRAGDEAELILSVCTGALVLAAAELLNNAPATTHHGAFDELAALSSTTTVVEGKRYVQSSERVWTSAGISAGIDLSLQAVELLLGREIRDAVIDEMEWGW